MSCYANIYVQLYSRAEVFCGVWLQAIFGVVVCMCVRLCVCVRESSFLIFFSFWLSVIPYRFLHQIVFYRCRRFKYANKVNFQFGIPDLHTHTHARTHFSEGHGNRYTATCMFISHTDNICILRIQSQNLSTINESTSHK